MIWKKVCNDNKTAYILKKFKDAKKGLGYIVQ